MATMNVSLPADLVNFVEGQVAAGGYSSASEVVRESLRLLRRERDLYEEKLAILRREIDLALDQVAAGQFSDRTVEEIAAEALRESFGE
jgi:antitoxin ParD1/3/4